jgi:predicted transcriptional regulator
MADSRTRAHEVVVKRSDVLSALTDGALRKPELVERLGVSRSTVDRAVRELESYGLVARTAEGVALVGSGRLVGELVDSFERRLSEVTQLQTLLEFVDETEEFTVPIDVFEGGDVYMNDSYRDDNVASEIPHRVRNAVRIDAVSKTISSTRSAKALYDAVVDRGVDYRGVYAVSVASFIQAWGSEQRRAMAATGNYEAFVTERDVPVSVFNFTFSEGDEVAVFVYDDRSNLLGVVVNDDPAAIEWGREVYRDYRTDAFEITAELRN